MPKRKAEILVVEDDLDLADMIGSSLRSTIQSNVTCVGSVADALREELTAHHDLVVSSFNLPDGDGLVLARQLGIGRGGPVILLADDLTTAEAISAMRLGVKDILIKPFDMFSLMERSRALIKSYRKRRRDEVRLRRLRRLASGIVNERRDLQKRIDLICRDFVHAYRRLAEKVSRSRVLGSEVDQ